MAIQEHHCCSGEHPCKVETLVLDDGRKAERHVSMDANGNEVIEVFAEEKRPLKLEKRITREYKQIVAKETHENIHEGTVEVKSVDAGPLQVGVAHNFVTRDELQHLISDGVVAGVSALMENYEPVVAQSAPVMSAQSIVEKNVSEKNKSNVVNMIMVAIVVAQAAFFGYVFFVM